MNYYERALELKDETIAHRRYFHTNAELGLNMPKAQAYVLAELKKLGIEEYIQIYRDAYAGFTATLPKN